MTKDEMKIKIFCWLKQIDGFKTLCINEGINLKLYKMNKSQLEIVYQQCENLLNIHLQNLGLIESRYGLLPVTIQNQFLWGKNLRAISKTYWEQMTKQDKKECGYICGHCGADMSEYTKYFHGHEIFNIYINTKQKTITIECKEIRYMCKKCHDCYHIASTLIHGGSIDELELHRETTNMRIINNTNIQIENQYIYVNGSKLNDEESAYFDFTPYNYFKVVFKPPITHNEKLNLKWKKACERWNEKYLNKLNFMKEYDKIEQLCLHHNITLKQQKQILFDNNCIKNGVKNYKKSCDILISLLEYHIQRKEDN